MNEARVVERDAERAPLVTELGGGSGAATKLIAFVCAVALAGALLAGFLFLKKRHDDKLAAAKRAEQAAKAAKAAVPPRAQVFQDEVRLAGSQALVGGTVKNISDAPLESLSVEIALKGRTPQRGTEKRTVAVNPGNLGPGEQGHYSLQISPDDWAGAQVVRLRSGASDADVPFKPEVGQPRPAERPPASKVVIEQKPRRKGDDFLNTPDTPVRIP
ncbi:MAG: hypothetical protein M3268_07325 [Acidobacteriota bacterium]|nr:hypothetical protein [Acidobacteriota bacterium]